MTDATLPLTCGKCGYFNLRPGTGEGLCMNSKADHYGHLLQSWHPVPWVAIMDADTSEIIPGAECFMDEGDECDCDDCDCGPGKDC